MEPVANIHLSDAYKNLLVELSIYIKENVLSEGALICTQNVIEHNEGHYTAWSFRRRVLFSLKSSLEDELEFIRSFTIETPKNYQLWQHRQIIVERLGSIQVALEDLEATKVQLNLDAKNIHCWQYRQWLLLHFKLPLESEFDFIETLLNQDVYNNSAWNHRVFLMTSSQDFKENKEEYIKMELEKIITPFLNESTQDNESFWNYLAFLVQSSSLSMDLVISKLSERISPSDLNENCLYLRFLSRFDCENIMNRREICDKLKELHPINRAFWTSLIQK